MLKNRFLFRSRLIALVGLTQITLLQVKLIDKKIRQIDQPII